MMTILQALAYGKQQLNHLNDADIDVSILLEFVLDCNPTYLRTWPEKQLTQQQSEHFKRLIAQRVIGKPVAYIVGSRGFWSLDLKVTEATLIPRPDTELLVSLALDKLDSSINVADLGTGSGAIALSLAYEYPDKTVFAMDYSLAALQVAQHNARVNQINNVKFWQGHWLNSVKPNSFDLIVSNPPYIEVDDPHLAQGDVRFEPLTALASGADGLDDIRIIIQQSIQCLTAGGWLMIEHGYHQSEQVHALFSAAGFINITTHHDFGGRDRVVIGQVRL